MPAIIHPNVYVTPPACIPNNQCYASIIHNNTQRFASLPLSALRHHMCRRILIISCLLIVTLTQSGCIVMLPNECKRETPYTGYHDINWKAPKWPGDNPRPSSQKRFREDWGEPSEIITVSESEETWVYKSTLWCGLFPLILPVCEGFDRVDFRDNTAIRLHTKHVVLGLFLFPLIAQMESPCRYPIIYGATYSKVEKIPDTAGLVIFYRQRALSSLTVWSTYTVKTVEADITDLYHNGYYPYFSTICATEFWSDSKKNSVIIDVKPGQTYYLKVESVNGVLSIIQVAPEVAEEEIADCKLILPPIK